MVDRLRRPGITRVGRVVDTGDGLVVTEWALAECTSGCLCHRHPTAGHLTLFEGADGALGLVSYRPGGCLCCTPWMPVELWGVLEDLAAVAAFEHLPG